MTTYTAPKTWATNEKLTSADMNTYVRDNVKHVKEWVKSGRHTASGTGGSTHSGTITFGVTYSAAPDVVATVKDVTGAGLFVHWTADPTTTTVAYMVTARDTGDTFSSSYTIHWVAVGILA